jgi:uncharacterized RDD family membrane protein YckC
MCPDGDTLPRCAGPARRLSATLVDMIVFAGISVALGWPLYRSLLPLIGSDPSYDRIVAALAEPRWLNHAAGILGLWIALWHAYFVVGWGLLGATPGKWLFGLRVVDHQRRYPVGASRALLRLAAYSVSSATLGVGHLLILLRRDRRALHDILAGTRVVRTIDARAMTRGQAPPPQSVPAIGRNDDETDADPGGHTS